MDGGGRKKGFEREEEPLGLIVKNLINSGGGGNDTEDWCCICCGCCCCCCGWRMFIGEGLEEVGKEEVPLDSPVDEA